MPAGFDWRVFLFQELMRLLRLTKKPRFAEIAEFSMEGYDRPRNSSERGFRERGGKPRFDEIAASLS